MQNRFSLPQCVTLPLLLTLGCFAGPVACSDDSASESGSGAGDSAATASAGMTSTTGTASGTGGTGVGDTSATSGNSTIPDTTGEVPVCPGPDMHEENDDLTTAKEVLIVAGRGQARAGVMYGDDDVFRFAATNTDPIIVGGAYTVIPGDTTDLSIYIYGADGNEVARDTRPRAGVTENMAARLIPKAAGGQYFVKVTSDSDMCVGYELDIDTLACTDAHEDNEVIATATPLAVPPGQSTTPGPLTITDGDEDVYGFTVAGTDPATATVTYTVQPGDATDLSVYVYDASGSEVARNTAARTDLTEAAVVSWRPKAANGQFFVRVTSSEPTCTGYALGFDTQLCYDAFEDNDEFSSLKLLGAGQQAAKIADSDEDYYQIATPPVQGSCTVSYTVGTGSTQDLSIYLYNATNGELARNTTPRAGLSESAVVSWINGQEPFALRVTASEPECVDYTIVCQ